MSQNNLLVVQSLYEAFGRGDIPAVLAAMSPDLVWIAAENSPVYTGKPFRGPQEVLENVFMRLAGEWEGFTIHVGHLLEAGDTVIMEGRYGGTYKATGRKTNAQVVHLWAVQDGKLVEFRQYCDTAELRDVSGRGNQATASA